MHERYPQALAAMPVEDVEFILSQLPQQNAAIGVTSSNIVGQGAGIDGLADDDSQDGDEESRRRRHIEREWPEAGTELTADYFGVLYGAEIITATKRLKSGKQIRITSGAAKGAICDSFSEAMIVATEDQRNKENLARKGVSNGWLFWQWEGKPENIAGDDPEES